MGYSKESLAKKMFSLKSMTKLEDLTVSHETVPLIDDYFLKKLLTYTPVGLNVVLAPKYLVEECRLLHFARSL
jgi:hypothetical protein